MSADKKVYKIKVVANDVLTHHKKSRLDRFINKPSRRILGRDLVLFSGKNHQTTLI